MRRTVTVLVLCVWVCICLSVCVSVCYHSNANITYFYALNKVRRGVILGFSGLSIRGFLITPSVQKLWREKANMQISMYLPRPAVPPTSTDLSVFIRILRAMYGYTETTLYYTEEIPRSTSDLTLPCTGAPSASGKILRVTSPAWCQCSSCSTYVGVSSMQESPNESDASASTLIIVAFCLFSCTLPVLFTS